MTERPELERVLQAANELAAEYLHDLPRRRVGPRADSVAVMAALGRKLADTGVDAERVIREMARAVEPGLVASAGPRYFGFVFGGALPASLGADWLTSAWDQNAVLHAASPAAAAAEQVAGEWLLDLLGLPPDASFGLTGGAGLANAVALAAARHAVLERVGWDVEARGLFGAPEIRWVPPEAPDRRPKRPPDPRALSVGVQSFRSRRLKAHPWTATSMGPLPGPKTWLRVGLQTS